MSDFLSFMLDIVLFVGPCTTFSFERLIPVIYGNIVHTPKRHTAEGRVLSCLWFRSRSSIVHLDTFKGICIGESLGKFAGLQLPIPEVLYAQSAVCNC